MLQRFAAGSAVGSIAIAVAACAMSLIPGMTFERLFPLTVLWCFAPAAWGVWAALTPARWMPKYLPVWGGLLGLILALMGAVILDFPSRFTGFAVPLLWRVAALPLVALLYFGLWEVVRAIWSALTPRMPVAHS